MMDTATFAILITSGAGLIKMFWSDWQADKRALRERQWAMADRSSVAQQLAAKVESTAAEVADAADVRSMQLQHAIAANTELTGTVGEKADAAFKEANDVNRKIEHIQRRLLEREGS